MENEWKMLLWLWNIIPLSPDNNPVLIARMLHKTWITRLVLGQWVDLNYPLDISSLEWNLHSTLMTMSMPNVWNYMAGSVIYAVWWPRTKWGLKCSILVMALCIRMELMVPSGYAAKNARKPITWSVLLNKKKEKSSFPFFALLMNVGGRGSVKRVIKRVTVPTLFSVGPRQKTTAKKIRRGKDGRVIAPRKAASAGRNIKEQKWKAEDMDLVFDLWERNKTLPPEKRLSKNQIHKQTGVPYTTVCERLSGRRGGGKRGKIAGGKRTPKVLEQGTSG